MRFRSTPLRVEQLEARQVPAVTFHGGPILPHVEVVPLFLGRDWNKWAEIVHLDGFSGHADQDDFLAYLTPLAGRVDQVCLVHGEGARAEALAEALRGAGFPEVTLPEVGTSVALR